MRLVHKIDSRLPFPESSVIISEDYSCAASAKVCSSESVYSYSFFLHAAVHHAHVVCKKLACSSEIDRACFVICAKTASAENHREVGEF